MDMWNYIMAFEITTDGIKKLLVENKQVLSAENHIKINIKFTLL